MALITAITLAVLALWLWYVWTAPLARLFMRAQRWRGHLQSRHVTVNGQYWHYLEGGQGEPLILLHGFSADAHHWTLVSGPLSRHFRVIAPDLPGWGASSAPRDGDYGIERQAHRLGEFLDALGLGNYHLGGNSMGGYIACTLAVAQPGRVRSLWLLAPGGLHQVQYSPLLGEIAAERHNPLVIRHIHDFEKLIDYCFVRRPWIPWPLRRWLARRAARTTASATEAFDAMRHRSRPLEALAPELTMPTLIVWGENDQVLHPDGADALAALLPNGSVIRLPRTGHLAMLEQPRRIVGDWLEWVAPHRQVVPGKPGDGEQTRERS